MPIHFFEKDGGEKPNVSEFTDTHRVTELLDIYAILQSLPSSIRRYFYYLETLRWKRSGIEDREALDGPISLFEDELGVMDTCPDWQIAPFTSTM